MWDYGQNKPNNLMEWEAAKTLCAYMNTKGGTLIIGLTNKGEALGLENDFACLTKRPNKDGYEQKPTGIVNSLLGKENRPYVHLSWTRRDGKDIAVLNVDPSNHPVCCTTQGAPVFFIRSGTLSQPLNVQRRPSTFENIGIPLKTCTLYLFLNHSKTTFSWLNSASSESTRMLVHGPSSFSTKAL